jgi:hypothetical protein
MNQKCPFCANPVTFQSWVVQNAVVMYSDDKYILRTDNLNDPWIWKKRVFAVVILIAAAFYWD